MTFAADGKEQSLVWADLIRTLAVFGVILVHAAADVITQWGSRPAGWWWAANLYDSLARGCVPVFIMLSGALLLPKQESYTDFFRKRFRRIALPFAVWTVLYLLWKKCLYAQDLGWQEALRQAAGNGVHFHLWFLYILIGLYFLTPLLRVLLPHAPRKDLLYFLVLWFCVSSLLPFWEKMDSAFFHTGLRLRFPMEPFQGFAGYFILGYLIRRFPPRSALRTAVPGWLLGLAVSFAGTYMLCRHAGAFRDAFYDNMAPNVVLYASSFFLLMRSAETALANRLPPALCRLAGSLSAASFGIYLIHPMILDALAFGRWGFTLKADSPHPLLMIPLAAAAAYLISLATVNLIRKIPYLDRIV